MLRIGDFARLAGVTVRALRHYEAERLLAPAHVDEATGYRSYRFEQLTQIDRILALRDLGFPLADIRGLLTSDADVRALQRAIAADPAAPELSVRVRPIEDVRALTIRARIPGGGDPVGALFEEAEARAARDRADRSPFLLFHGPRDVEACIPVRAACRAAGVRVVPGAPLAGSITYSGAYTQTRSLHARMLRWLRRSGLHAAGPLREVYHRFGADQRGYRLPARRIAASPEQFVTELQVPAEEAE